MSMLLNTVFVANINVIQPALMAAQTFVLQETVLFFAKDFTFSDVPVIAETQTFL